MKILSHARGKAIVELSDDELYLVAPTKNGMKDYTVGAELNIYDAYNRADGLRQSADFLEMRLGEIVVHAQEVLADLKAR